MPYNISKQLVKKLPEEEQESPEAIGKFLLDRDSAVCWLCEGPMNVAAEILEADHDEPGGEGGETTLANLHLVHQECNRSKRNLTSNQVRPYLKLRRYIKGKRRSPDVDGITEHFDIAPSPCHVTVGDNTLTVLFPHNQTTEVPIFSETTQGRTWKYAFIEVPREAIFNDGASSAPQR